MVERQDKNDSENKNSCTSRNFYYIALYLSSSSIPSDLATTTAVAESPTTFKDVTNISTGLFIAKINEYASNAASLLYPIPVNTVNSIIAPAPGAAGVPIEAIRASNPITIMFPIVTSYPALDAINIAAIICIIAVPFIFIVIPSGNVNEAISSLTPNSSTVVFVLSGKVAADEDVENPNKATLDIFLTKVIGFSLAASATKIA